MLAPLRLTLKSLDPRTAALVAPTAGASALRGYLARVLAEGKQGVKAKRGGPVRFGLDVEAIIEAVGVETSLAESGGGEGASPEEPGKAATSMKADDGAETRRLGLPRRRWTRGGPRLETRGWWRRSVREGTPRGYLRRRRRRGRRCLRSKLSVSYDPQSAFGVPNKILRFFYS